MTRGLKRINELYTFYGGVWKNAQNVGFTQGKYEDVFMKKTLLSLCLLGLSCAPVVTQAQQSVACVRASEQDVANLFDAWNDSLATAAPCCHALLTILSRSPPLLRARWSP